MDEWTVELESPPDTERFADLLRPQTDAEAAEMAESIESCGFLAPIVVWSDNGTWHVIDGIHRERYWRSLPDDTLTMPPVYTELPATNVDQVVEWILRNQMGRRNLSGADCSHIRAKMVALMKGAGDGDTYEKVAEATGVSRRTVANDVKKAKPEPKEKKPKPPREATPESLRSGARLAVGVVARAVDGLALSKAKVKKVHELLEQILSLIGK